VYICLNSDVTLGKLVFKYTYIWNPDFQHWYNRRSPFDSILSWLIPLLLYYFIAFIKMWDLVFSH